MQNLLLTAEDVLQFSSMQTMTKLPGSAEAKILEASAQLRSSYIIDKTKYDRVFVTSDIHTDLLKLDRMLTVLGIVKANAVKGSFNSLCEKIPQIEWLPERTLLVIVGDVVDGRRTPESQIPDPKGNVEILLHAYLYNLRLQARAKHSEVVFTIGNHDYHTVISEDSTNDHLYDKYVHDTARRFFTSRIGRRTCLIPFYNCCPYVMIDLGGEVAFIHGGFLGYDFAKDRFMNNTNLIKRIQEKIDAVNDFSALGAEDHEFLSNAGDDQRDGYEISPLWSRAYAHLHSSRVCPTISPFYKMVVVGHCQMAFDCGKRGEHTAKILDTEPYTKHNCGGQNGCVVVTCETDDGPQLGFVDIGFSRAFSGFLTQGVAPMTVNMEFDRRAEMLHLIHNRSVDTSDRYFNMILRENASSNNIGEPEIVWAALPQAALIRVQEIKQETRILGLEYTRKPEFLYRDDRFSDFQDGLWVRYKLIIESDPVFSKRWIKLAAETVLKKYILHDLYLETFCLNNENSPTPLHFIAIDKNLQYLNLFLDRMEFPAAYLFRVLPPSNSNTSQIYDRFNSIPLSKYANKSFLDIINILLKNSVSPIETKTLYQMKVTFIEAAVRLRYRDKPEIMEGVLEYVLPTLPTMLHHAVINKDQLLFDGLMRQAPPIAWIEARLPKAKSPFYEKFIDLVPEKYANKTARGIIDIMLDSEQDENERLTLTSNKQKLLSLSAKPKTVRNASGLFMSRLARKENEPFITNRWRRTLGLKKQTPGGTGGTRKTRKTRKQGIKTNY